MNQEETIEIEIDSELLEKVGIIAAMQGLTTEQYIRGIVEAYVRKKPSPRGKVARRTP